MQLGYYLLMLLTSMLWAGNFVAGKFLVGHADVWTLTDLRWGIGVLLLLPIVWWREGKVLPPRKALLWLFLMGLTGVVGFNAFMFWALERTTADNTGLISALNPVSIAIMSYFVLRERITMRQLIAMAVSLLGVLVVITRGDWEVARQIEFNAGDLYMLMAVGFWGLYSVFGKLALRHVTPFMSTLWGGMFGLAILLPFSLPHAAIHEPDRSFWFGLAYIGVGATVLAMLFWNIAVQKLGGTTSGVFLNFNPIFTAIFAYLLLDEQMGVAQVVGTAIVIAGVYAFNRKPAKSR